MPNPSIAAIIVSEITAFIRTDGRTEMAISTRDLDYEYMYFMVLESLLSSCYILSVESSIYFYLTSIEYKNQYK